MYDICCIGHITLDKVVTPESEVYMPGGTSFYFAHSLYNIDHNFLLVTALAKDQISFVENLREKGVHIQLLPSTYTVYFENIYPANQDIRIQRVWQKADPFQKEDLENVDAKIFHLGSLLADDFSFELIRSLSEKGIVSMDVQGMLRAVEDTEVVAVDWTEKRKALPYIDILKANESEMEVLTGTDDIAEGARVLAQWGVREVVITLGSKGSVIYANNNFHLIPAFIPKKVVDATGCGDTYMAGFLYKRSLGAGLQEAGEFGAAMATLNIETSGPFNGSKNDILAKIKDNARVLPSGKY
ncbi:MULTISPECIES: PfkB family carbohydrate kinase [Chitinophagaceae]